MVADNLILDWVELDTPLSPPLSDNEEQDKVETALHEGANPEERPTSPLVSPSDHSHKQAEITVGLARKSPDATFAVSPSPCHSGTRYVNYAATNSSVVRTFTVSSAHQC